MPKTKRKSGDELESSKRQKVGGTGPVQGTLTFARANEVKVKAKKPLIRKYRNTAKRSQF
jgi:hypothetical protein